MGSAGLDRCRRKSSALLWLSEISHEPQSSSRSNAETPRASASFLRVRGCGTLRSPLSICATVLCATPDAAANSICVRPLPRLNRFNFAPVLATVTSIISGFLSSRSQVITFLEYRWFHSFAIISDISTLKYWRSAIECDIIPSHTKKLQRGGNLPEHDQRERRSQWQHQL